MICKTFWLHYELGEEMAHGHFRHTCFARERLADSRGPEVAVRFISKSMFDAWFCGFLYEICNTFLSLFSDIFHEDCFYLFICGHHQVC
ncbi:hypothetical protein RIF29_15395 [Crotalaria pallida]|uniref:Uncharacterized protein n=1 Tax=Crotalaria pallida TaxID=3830 RepID=A0AAN9ICK0_CROPI